ncbi:MAG: hypothetical protein LBJ26_15470 [Paenibacillus sp.]|nr:hypothetical protein [Paenibacillus sp.]
MAQRFRPISRAAVRGIASGFFFMAFFGTMWAYTGIMGLQGWGNPLLLSTSVAIGIILFIGGGSLMHAARKIKNPVSNAWLGKRIGMWFGIKLMHT